MTGRDTFKSRTCREGKDLVCTNNMEEKEEEEGGGDFRQKKHSIFGFAHCYHSSVSAVTVTQRRQWKSVLLSTDMLKFNLPDMIFLFFLACTQVKFPSVVIAGFVGGVLLLRINEQPSVSQNSIFTQAML